MHKNLCMFAMLVAMTACAVEDHESSSVLHEESGDALRQISSGTSRFGGAWRIQAVFNANSLITPVTIDQPPGVQIGLSPLSLKGAGIFYAYVDNLQNGYVLLNGGHQAGHDYTNRTSLALQSPDRLTGAPILTVDAALQSRLAVGTFPPISAPIGSKVLTGRIVSRMLMGDGTVNDSDPALGDMMVYATGAVQFSGTSL